MPLALIALLLAAQAPSPPPRIMQAPLAPPPPTVFIQSNEYPGNPSAPRERTRLDISVTADAETLWAGGLTVMTNQSSTVSRQQSEPAAVDCPTQSYGYVPNQTSAFNLTVAPMRQGNRDLYQVTVRWTRPGDPICGGRGASRTVEVSNAVELSAAGEAVVRGDAGLAIRLRRR